ncbi:MAG: DUF1211 domain-containing protein [Thermomicrobiales bacterium]|nr:DUF1211 domain-containing protein [Thermomicrobiales bacterium]MCO5222298.1 TMEM175 family protein [Thermomicrobiales bacterium]
MVDRDESLPPDGSEITGEEGKERAGELDRLISLSDGVFAFAMTLLVVTVEVPQMSDEAARTRLHHDIVDLWPQVLSYIVGFLVIAFLWASHRRNFARIQDFDARLVRLNIALLLLVAFLPFPTGTLGEYGNLAFPVILYAVILAMISVLFIVMIDHMDRNRHLMTRGGRNYDFARAKTRHLVTCGILLLSIPISLMFPGFGQVVWILLIFNHQITEWLLPHLPKRFQERGQS